MRLFEKLRDEGEFDDEYSPAAEHIVADSILLRPETAVEFEAIFDASPPFENMCVSLGADVVVHIVYFRKTCRCSSRPCDCVSFCCLGSIYESDDAHWTGFRFHAFDYDVTDSGKVANFEVKYERRPSDEDIKSISESLGRPYVDKTKEEWAAIESEAIENAPRIKRLAFLALEAIQCFNIPAVERKRVEPSQFEKYRYANKHGRKLNAHHVVVIDPLKHDEIVARAKRNHDRRKCREHSVRGFFRRRPGSGPDAPRDVRVKPFKRGDASLGTVTKTYLALVPGSEAQR